MHTRRLLFLLLLAVQDVAWVANVVRQWFANLPLLTKYVVAFVSSSVVAEGFADGCEQQLKPVHMSPHPLQVHIHNLDCGIHTSAADE